MRTRRCLAVFFLLAIAIPGCAQRQLRPVADIDPTPLLETVSERNALFEQGLSGVLEMDFRQGKKRFRGRAFIIAFPDGRFRLEIPGPLGSTFLIMTYDGDKVLAYYPEEGRAYRSYRDSPTINPYLPFPLPIKMGAIVSLLMGTPAVENASAEIRAFLLESGEKQLLLRSDDGVQMSYLFTGGPTAALRVVKAQETSMEMVVTTRKIQPYFPSRFVINLPDADMRGQWESVAFFDDDETVLQPDIPGSVHVNDLKGTP
jgi:hypothetical protein